jgi:hypothetical protein
MSYKLQKIIALLLCVGIIVYVWYGVKTQCDDVAIYHKCED